MLCNPTTLYDFYTDSKFSNSVEKFNCVQTAILRYYLTAHTGKRLKTQRLSKKTISKQIEKLKDISVDSSFDISTHLDQISKGGLMYGKDDMRSHISYGKRFFDFVVNSIVTVPKEADKNEILSYRGLVFDKSEWVKKKGKTNSNVGVKNKPNLYLDELKEKYPTLNDKELYQKAKISLDNLFKIMEDFSQYKNNRETTTEKDINSILIFIGWYKVYNNLSIDELSIDEIFPIISPYIDDSDDDFTNLSEENFIKLSVKEKLLKINIKKKSKEATKYVNKFLSIYRKESAVPTKKSNIQALISFCYFLYRDVTDVEEFDNFQDISLINRLRICMRDIPQEIDDDDYDDEEIIPFCWTEIEQVCERLRKEANQNHGFCKTRKNKKGSLLSKRSKASNIQAFLAIAFFCVMPPDRSRTFRELTFKKTLKYGLKNKKNGTFTSYENLEKEQKPKYYIHLLPYQYKTGKTYGTYWHEITNVKYQDGKYFYDYLNQWLFEGYRDELATAGKTDAIFIKRDLGASFTEDGTSIHDETSKFSQYITKIFNRKTKFPLNPHALRDIYVTHINNLNYSVEQRKSIAYMMHHDLETADKIYNKQTGDEKMALAIEHLKHLAA